MDGRRGGGGGGWEEEVKDGRSRDHKIYYFLVSVDLPSSQSGIRLMVSSSTMLIGSLTAKGREQKSYHPSSAQLTNNLRAGKRCSREMLPRHSCWVWVILEGGRKGGRERKKRINSSH